MVLTLIYVIICMRNENIALARHEGSTKLNNKRKTAQVG